MNKVKEKYIYYILGVLTLLFFLFGQGVMWYAMGGDSEAYYTNFGHHIEAKPFYPLLLHVLNLILGDGLYLYAASVIQMLLAVFCIIILISTIARYLELESFSIVIIWLASLFPFYLLLPEDPIPHVLMTESLTYPLLYFYTAILLKAIWDKKEKLYYISILMAIFMTLIRGQMLFLIAVSILSYGYYLLKNKIKLWKAGLFLLFTMLSVLVEGSLTAGYEKFFFDAPRQDYSAQTLVQKALFCADENNTDLFSDEIEKEIFEKTYKGMMEQESTYQFATGDLWDWKHTTGSFGANSYLVQDVIEEVLKEKGAWPEDEIEQENQVLYYSRQLSSKLLRENWKRCLSVSISMMPAGFVSTVLMHKESVYGLIHLATLLLYLFMIAGSILISKWSGQIIKESEYIWLVIVIAVINVVSANLIHFGLQRYLAYTVGLFYTGGYLMLRRLMLMWKKRRNVVSER